MKAIPLILVYLTLGKILPRFSYLLWVRRGYIVTQILVHIAMFEHHGFLGERQALL